jgi:phage shock protein PspC (stress-responsive transcriptional regulator)
MAAAARHGSLVAMRDDEYAGSGAGPGPGPRGPWPGPEQGPVPARPALRRDRRSRMIAGVCGGLGRHLDIDPVVFRILFALLTFFGGFGLLVYAAAWLFVPEDGENESEGHKLLRGGRGPSGAIALVVLIAVGFMVMLTVLDHDFWHAVPLLLLAAAIVAVLLWIGDSGRRYPHGGAPDGGGGGGSGGGWGPAAGPDQPQPWWQRPVTEAPTPPGSQAPPPPPATGSAEGGLSDAMPGSSGFTEGWTAGESAEPTSGRMPRRVTGVALSGALLVLGLVGVLAETGAVNVGWTEGLAVAVMAVGTGMVVGGWFGRARLLIPLGLVLSVPLILASAVGVPLHGETGDMTWAPVSAAAISSPYELAAGHGQLDLSAVDPNGGTVHVTAYVGAGQMIVTVPDDVALVVNAHVGVGRMQFTDGTMHSGLDVTKRFDSAASGPSKGTMVLDLKAGAGDVEVQRVG